MAYGYWTRDNTTTLTTAATNKMQFPDPQIIPLGITESGTPFDTFTVTAAGIYQVYFQVPVVAAGKLNIWVNGTELAHTTAGRATGTSQITNTALLELAAADSISIRVPTGAGSVVTENDVATIPINPLHSTLIITQIA
jgi:hypothetical protein